MRRALVMCIGLLLGCLHPGAGHALRDAKAFNAAILHGDDTEYRRLAHPLDIQHGKPLALEKPKLDESNPVLGKLISPPKYDVSRPMQVLEAGQELHTIVPISIHVEGTMMEIEYRTYFMGVSTDGGNTWRFVRPHVLKEHGRYDLFPDWNPYLDIPPEGGTGVLKNNGSPDSP